MKDVADLFWEIIRDMEIESFIDVGTGPNGVVGMHNLEGKNIRRKYAIDIYRIKPLPPEWQTVIMDGRNMPDKFPAKSIDIIQACDFIEHLTKADGIKWLKDCETIARKAVLIFTPLGWVRSSGFDVQPDNIYMQHHCAWTYEEFEEMGYMTARNDPENIWRVSNIVAWKVLEGKYA